MQQNFPKAKKVFESCDLDILRRKTWRIPLKRKLDYLPNGICYVFLCKISRSQFQKYLAFEKFCCTLGGELSYIGSSNERNEALNSDYVVDFSVGIYFIVQWRLRLWSRDLKAKCFAMNHVPFVLVFFLKQSCLKSVFVQIF